MKLGKEIVGNKLDYDSMLSDMWKKIIYTNTTELWLSVNDEIWERIDLVLRDWINKI